MEEDISEKPIIPKKIQKFNIIKSKKRRVVVELDNGVQLQRVLRI